MNQTITAAPSQFIPIVLNLVAAVLGALGQYLYKIGGLKLGVIPLIKNWYLYTGMILFCVVMVLFVWAFRLGGRLGVVYPVYATTFIWGFLIATMLDQEPYSWVQVLGIGFIMVGVSCIALGYAK